MNSLPTSTFETRGKKEVGLEKVCESSGDL